MVKKRIYIQSSMLVLFLLSILTGTLFDVKKVEAALLNAELLTNVTSTNNSGTSIITNPPILWEPTESSRYIDFSITGQARTDIDVKVLNGQKMAVIIFPAELVGKVTSHGMAYGEMAGLVNLKEVGLLSNVLTLLENLTNTLDNLGLLGSNPNLTNAIAALYAVEDLGMQAFSSDVIATNTYIAVNLDNSLGLLLGEDIPQLLTNLLNAVKTINVGLLGTVLNPVIQLLVTPLQALINSLLNPSTMQTLTKQLADAAILGEIDITIPTEIIRPTPLTAPLNAKFIGTIAKLNPNLIDINLLTSSDNLSYIYFGSEVFDYQLELPNNLNFGVHPIQTESAETFLAKENEEITTGTISIHDSRAKQKSWLLSVHQEGEWLNDTRMLASAELQVTIDNFQSTFTDGIITHYPVNTIVTIIPNQTAIPLIQLQNVHSMGEIHLSFSSFQLYIPENTPKYTGTYQTTLVWTLSDVP